MDCPVPVGRTAVVASQIIRSAFEKMGYRGTVTIHAFGEVSNLDPLVSELRDVECHDENTPTPSGVFLEDMNPSGIVFHHTPTGEFLRLSYHSHSFSLFHLYVFFICGLCVYVLFQHIKTLDVR